MVFFAGTFGLNFQMTSALMATQVFDKGAGEYGLLGIGMAVGSLAGALLAARRVADPACAASSARRSAFGVAEIVAGLMPSYLTFALMSPLLGLDRADHAQRRQHHRAAGLRRRHAGPGDGALHDDLHGRHAVRRAAHRLGRASTFGARWTLLGGGR